MLVNDLPVFLSASLLSGWLLLRELRCLDDAVCNHKDRDHFLHLISTSFFTINDHGISFSSKCLCWLSARDISVKSLNISMSSADVVDYFQLCATDKNLVKVQAIVLQLGIVNETSNGISRGWLGVMVFKSLSVRSFQLRSLKLCDCSLMSQLISATKSITLPQLTELILENVEITHAMFMFLFGNSSNLTKIDMLDAIFHSTNKCNLCQIVTHYPLLTVVGISGKIPYDQFQRMLVKCPLITVLKIGDAKEFSVECLNLLATKSQITGLQLSQSAPDTYKTMYKKAKGKDVVENFTQVHLLDYLKKQGKSLHFLNFSCLTSQHYLIMNLFQQKNMIYSYIPNIRYLNLNKTYVSFAVVIDILHMCDDLEYLNILQYNLDNCANPRGKNIKSKLHSIVVSTNSSYQHHNYFKVLFSVVPNLLRVDMHDCDAVTNELIEHLVTLHPNLIELVLSRCKNIVSDVITIIASHCHNLRVLDIVGCSGITAKVTATKQMKALLPYCLCAGPQIMKEKHGNGKFDLEREFITLKEMF